MSVTINPQSPDIATITIDEAQQVVLNSNPIVFLTGDDANTLGGQAPAYYRDRANHTGTQSDSTVTTLLAATGAVSRTQASKNADIVSLADFKSNAVMWSQALSSALALSDKIIDGCGLVIALDAAVVAQTTGNLVLKNLTIDISALAKITGAGNPDEIITFSGAQGSAVPLTLSASLGTNQIKISSTAGFNNDDWVWLESTDVFADTDTTPIYISQCVRIKSKDATTLFLYDDVLYDFNTTASAYVATLSLKSNITLSNINFLGAGANLQNPLMFDKCVDVKLSDIKCDHVDYTGIALKRCVNVKIDRTQIFDAQASGLSYGVLVSNGCYNVIINNPYGQDCRHVVTIGGKLGINHFIEVNNITAKSMRDAGLDSHPASNFVTFKGGTIECAATATLPKDGIMFQGQNPDISDIKVIGAYIKSVAVNSFASLGRSHSVRVSNIQIHQAGLTDSTSIGVEVCTKTAGVIDGVEVSGISCNGVVHQGVYIRPEFANILNVAINDNPKIKAITSAVYFDARYGFDVDGFAVQNSNLDSETPIYLYGPSGIVKNGLITGNRIKSTGAYGLRFLGATDCVERNNRVSGYSSKRAFIDTGAVRIDLDRADSTIRTITNSAGVIAEQDRYIIANRASSTMTLTLPNAADHIGRELNIKTITAQAVVSASADVVPLAGGSAGTAILSATAGNWAALKSDGTAWVMLSGKPV